MQQRLTLALLLALSAITTSSALSGEDQASPLIMHVGRDGYLSCFDMTGPFNAKKASPVLNETTTEENLRRIETQNGRGTVLRATPGMFFKTKQFKAVLLSATLRADDGGRYWLTLGTGGPVRVFLNNRLVHTVDAVRKARADTDLVPIDLAPGDNTIAILVKNQKKRWWRAMFRLLDKDFSPAEDLKIILRNLPPGTSVPMATGTLVLKRTLDHATRSVTIHPSLRFDGGRPVDLPRQCQVSFTDGPKQFDTLGESIPIPEGAQSEIRFSPYRFEADPIPKKIVVQCGDARFSKAIGFMMQHVRELSSAEDILTRAFRDNREVSSSTVESLTWRIEHLTALIESGDEDYLYLTREIRNTTRMARALVKGEDPYWNRRNQVQRRGYLSKLDSRYHPYTLYVPPLWSETDDRKHGLVVMLHGLNAPPMKAMQSVFGLPLQEGELGTVRARHPLPVSPAPFFVLAPNGFGPSGYRAFGEQDVMDVIDIVAERYRINPNRIYITGPSMGGIGAASVPLHYPDRFAAAAPLCGYHSMFVYRNIRQGPIAPWEKFLLQFRSNADWAANGRHLPLFIVHGLKDTPMHSRVLAKAYTNRNYPVKMETPDLGHNVWDQTYRGGAIFKHFRKYKRDPNPQRVTFTTARLRYRDAYWITIDDVENHATWSKVNAERKWAGHIEAKTQNVTALTLRNDTSPKARQVNKLIIDDTALDVSPLSTEWSLMRSPSGWRLVGDAPTEDSAIRKRPGLQGPLDDAYFDPLLFVYSSGDPTEERLTKRLAHSMRKPKSGVSIEWPVKKDEEVTPDDIAHRSLVIIGTPVHNRLLGRIHEKLPIQVSGEAISAGGRHFKGTAPAASFIYPNPLNPNRYVVVHTATSLRGLFYAGHLPDAVPDYIIFDGPTWHRKRERTLDDRTALAAGFFNREWQLEKSP